MTIGTFLTRVTKGLKAAGVESARLDCLILLEDQLHKDRAYILAHLEHKIGLFNLLRLNNKVERRAKHIPLAYIRGKSEFYGRTFHVNRNVLCPRPETEEMITQLRDLPLGKEPKILDIGSGSGILGITAKLEIPDSNVTLLDIDKGTLSVAKRNAESLKAEVSYEVGDLLLGHKGEYDVFLANLPYVPSYYMVSRDVLYEPRHALFADGDGLVVYGRLFEELAARAHRPRFILTESLTAQHAALKAMAHSIGYRLRQSKDLIQIFELENND